MSYKDLALSHPMEALELYDRDPTVWNFIDTPSLYTANDRALIPLTPYMSAIWRVDADRTDPNSSVECLPDGRCEFSFKLTCKVNELWLAFFEKRRGTIDASIKEDTLVIRCDAAELQKQYEKISHFALCEATKDYCNERRELVWLVLEKMKRLEMCENAEAEINVLLEIYRRDRREQSQAAEAKGISVSLSVEKINRRYRDMLEGKFAHCWSKVLDEETIRKYRALFEQEFLVS